TYPPISLTAAATPVIAYPIPAAPTDCNVAHTLPDVTVPPYVNIKPAPKELAAIPLAVNLSPFTAATTRGGPTKTPTPTAVVVTTGCFFA
ncbi:11114_t:CDS:1, partial [Ambispora gerdemannii]